MMSSTNLPIIQKNVHTYIYIYIYIKHKLYTERKGTAEQIGQNASN